MWRNGKAVHGFYDIVAISLKKKVLTSIYAIFSSCAAESLKKFWYNNNESTNVSLNYTTGGSVVCHPQTGVWDVKFYFRGPLHSEI